MIVKLKETTVRSLIDSIIVKDWNWTAEILFCFVYLIVFEFVLFFFVPFTYIETSEIQASEEHKESYPTSQCAAVTTQYLLIRVPPQMCRRSVVCMDTMYLIEWGTGAYPPTMRSFTRSSPATSTQWVGDKKKKRKKNTWLQPDWRQRDIKRTQLAERTQLWLRYYGCCISKSTTSHREKQRCASGWADQWRTIWCLSSGDSRWSLPVIIYPLLRNTTGRRRADSAWAYRCSYCK